jgi:hypothetical protein
MTLIMMNNVAMNTNGMHCIVVEENMLTFPAGFSCAEKVFSTSCLSLEWVL